jgi:predicted short-subunit dehydrogenase-like oxidoreductase (DUF2520 family)
MGPETSELRKGIAVIGAGNWGSSLAAGVVASRLPLVEVVTRRPERRRVGGMQPVLWERARLDAEVLWLCVPDREIQRAAERLAAQRPSLRGQLVIHSSGAMTVAALEAAQRAGAGVGGVAPAFTFPTRKPVKLRDVTFIVEPGAGQARRLASLVRVLGGKPLQVATDKKVFYHAAATMASPLMVSYLEAAVATACLAGLGRRDAETVVGRLAEATLTNFFDQGAVNSFSGPFARGDAKTIELHLQGLLKHRTLHRVYLALARNAVASLPVRNREVLGAVVRGNS